MDEKRKLQLLLLLIAKEIDRICNKHHIDYFLDGGTQLGAIRHKGFIPWDDDFDIAMKRADYEKFISICAEELDKSKFFLQTEWTENKYCFAFAKIRLIGTEIIENFSKNVDVHQGIFVDIFPYDNLPDKESERKKFLRKNYMLKSLLWVKCGYGGPVYEKKVSYKMIKMLVSPIPIALLKKKRNQLIIRFNNINTEYCFTSDYPKFHFRNEWFEKAALYDFEVCRFTGFEQYDEMLTMLYGNYMVLPPEKDRIQHSKYRINFGEYVDIDSLKDGLRNNR